MWTLKRANPITEDEEYVLPRPIKRTRRQDIVEAVYPTQRLDWEDRVDVDAFDRRLRELFRSAMDVALQHHDQDEHEQQDSTQHHHSRQRVPGTTTRHRETDHDESMGRREE